MTRPTDRRSHASGVGYIIRDKDTNRGSPSIVSTRNGGRSELRPLVVASLSAICNIASQHPDNANGTSLDGPSTLQRYKDSRHSNVPRYHFRRY